MATVRHYLREGLLPEGTKTSRNMAYYSPELVERIRLIKQLQEERFMPLRVIGDLLERHAPDPGRLRDLVMIEDRVIERAREVERERTPIDLVSERYQVPREVLDRAEALRLLAPEDGGYDPSEVRLIEAISRFRAGGFDERIGFTIHDAARFVEPLAELARRELELLERLAAEVDPERALEMVEAGVGALEQLVAAMHARILASALERRRCER